MGVLKGENSENPCGKNPPTPNSYATIHGKTARCITRKEERNGRRRSRPLRGREIVERAFRDKTRTAILAHKKKEEKDIAPRGGLEIRSE